MPRGLLAGSPLVQEWVQDHQVRGCSPSYKPKGPGRGKPSFADGHSPYTDEAPFRDQEIPSQVEYGSWPKWENKRKIYARL